MRLYWFAITLGPIAIGSVALWFFRDTSAELSTYGSPEWITFAGTCLSYVGLATSIYAVIRIAELTRRSFARERLPDLLASLTNVGDRLATFSGDADELRSERFVSGIPALLRSLQRVRDVDITKLAKASIKAQAKLIKWTSHPNNKLDRVSSAKEYWALAELVNELLVEVDERIKEEKAAR